MICRRRNARTAPTPVDVAVSIGETPEPTIAALGANAVSKAEAVIASVQDSVQRSNERGTGSGARRTQVVVPFSGWSFSRNAVAETSGARRPIPWAKKGRGAGTTLREGRMMAGGADRSILRGTSGDSTALPLVPLFSASLPYRRRVRPWAIQHGQPPTLRNSSPDGKQALLRVDVNPH